MRKRKFSGRKALIAIALIAVLYVNVLVVVTPGVSIATRSGGELILNVAMQDDMKTRNILGSGDVWTYMVLRYCYDSTLKENLDGELIPYVAQYSGNEPDKLFGCDWDPMISDYNPHKVTVTYDFTNVKFHDSVQVTVDDVLASYQIVALHPKWNSDLACLMDNNGEPGSNFTTTHWLWVEKVYESEDKLEAKLTFRLQENFAMFYKKTLSITIFPQHVWEGTGDSIHEDFGKILNEKGNGVSPADGGFDINKALAWDITDDSHVIGNGPFKFKEWKPGQYAKIEKYEKYFYMKPNIDGILFKILKTIDAAVMALKNGDVDYIAWSISPDYLEDLTNDPNINISITNEMGFTYLAFNMRKKDFGYDVEHNDVGKPFRKATAHCVDKNAIVTTLLQNYGFVANGPVSPANTLWFNDSLPTYPLDVEKAKLILDNAGIVDADHDGWRELPTLGDAQFDILTPPADYDPIRSAAGLMIATQMREAGINVVSKPTAFGEIVRRIDARDFDMYILDWKIEGTDPDYLYNLFYSGNVEAGQNYPGYDNTKFDELILASRAEMNETKRVGIIKDCQGLLVEDLPYDVLYYRQNIEAYRSDRFTNWTLYQGSIFNFWSILGIYGVLDATPPTVTDITVVPDPQEVDDYVNISANVTDNMAVDTVWINITDPIGDAMGNFTMSYDSVNERYYKNQTYGIVGTYHFIIWANDTSDNWNFSLGQFTMQDITSPVIISVTPEDLATNVLISTNIVIEFSEPMNKTATEESFTLETDGVSVSGIFSWNDANDTMTFDPTADLSGETKYWVNMTTAATDLASNTLSTPWSSSFTTEDVTPPTVSSTSPTSGQLDVPIDTTITITFSEAMNKTTAQEAIRISGGLIPIWFSWSNDNTTVTFTPSSNLDYDTQYTITLNASIAEDIAGNKLDGDKDGIGGDDYSWSFTSEIETGTLYGTITDKDDNSIANATVTFYYTNGTIAGTTTTDANGNYTIDLPPGIYDIKIEKSGFETKWEKNVEVTTDQATTTDLTLPLTTDVFREYLWAILLIIIIILVVIIVALIAKKKKPIGEVEEEMEDEVEESEKEEILEEDTEESWE